MIFDSTNPRALTEIGSFDTYLSPSANTAGTDGAWGVYPFLPSGTLLVSDIENGLFLLKRNETLPPPLAGASNPPPPRPARGGGGGGGLDGSRALDFVGGVRDVTRPSAKAPLSRETAHGLPARRFALPVDALQPRGSAAACGCPRSRSGLWHNFGDVDVFQNGRTIARRAFDLGITHFDLANNYGPSPGSAEETFGALMRKDFHPFRDEMIISSKAGYLMWPGPYGEWGSRKYLVASCDQSLARMGLHVRRHLLQPPLRPGHAARRDHGRARLHRALGPRAVRRHLELQPGADGAGREASCSELGTPCLIHQPSYNMFNRWIEDGLTADAREGAAWAASCSRRWRRAC